MSQDPSSLPAAGWYPDPADPTGRRYWDGQRWTQHTLPSAWDQQSAASEQPSATPAQAPDQASDAAAGEPEGETAASDSPAATGPGVDEAGPASEEGAPATEEPEPPTGEPEPPTGDAHPAPELTDAGISAAGISGAAAATSATEAAAAGAGELAPAPPPQAEQAAGGWGAPGAAAAGGIGAAPPPYPSAAPTPYPGYEAYAPQTAPLTPSGMRRISALFSDMGRILKRAWWQILVVSLVLWVAWAIVATAVSAMLIDFGKLSDAVNLATQASRANPNRPIPSELQDEITDAFAAVPNTTSWVTWVLVGIFMALLFALVISLQVVAVNRLGMDAAAGRPVEIGAAVRAALSGGPRLFGYYLLLTVLIIAVTLILLLIMAATSAVPPLLALVIMLTIAGSIVVSLFLTGRLAPITAQVVLGRGALGWTWRATRTKFWAVLGRYLLWSLVASVITQVVISIVSIPIFLVTSASLTVSSSQLTPTALFTWLATVVLSFVVGAVTYVGIVPIWRDLTDDPAYRSIANGQPLPDPA